MMDFDILGFLGLGTKQIYYYAETRRVYTFNEQDLFRIMGMLCFFRVFYFKFNRQFSILRSVKMGIVGFICCAAYHDVITQTVNGYGKMLRDVDWTYGLWHPSYHKSFTILPYLQNNYFTLPRYGQLDFNWVPNLTFTERQTPDDNDTITVASADTYYFDNNQTFEIEGHSNVTLINFE